jgi:transposase
VQRQIATLYQQGHSIHQISKQLKIGYGTAWNYVQRAKTGQLIVWLEGAQ